MGLHRIHESVCEVQTDSLAGSGAISLRITSSALELACSRTSDFSLKLYPLKSSALYWQGVIGTLPL